jgi:hypothetical protein
VTGGDEAECLVHGCWEELESGVVMGFEDSLTVVMEAAEPAEFDWLPAFDDSKPPTT